MAKLLVTGVSEALPERRSSGHYSSPNDWALNLVLYNLLGKDLVGLFFLKKERKTIQQGSDLDGNVATHLSAYMITRYRHYTVHNTHMGFGGTREGQGFLSMFFSYT